MPLCCLISAATWAAEEDPAEENKDKTKINAGTLGGIKLRGIGPALMSGRIADIALHPDQPNTWYVAAGSGNLWKTVNAGTTWSPIFDNYGSYSIGCVTVDPNQPHTVWVGTGENVGGRHVGYGDGVYLSRDAGKSFKNMGLKASEHIGKILVDPRDSDTVYVAVQGPLWSPGGERGLYKTEDGGKTWSLILSKGEYTGVTDVAFDPRDPDVLYAATHQRHRTVWALINGGPESGLHKSEDGGATWRELKKGLPSGDLGKMAVAVSPQKPDVVYLSVELARPKGGIYRSEDRGESWSQQSDYSSEGTGPHYYQEMWCDPHRYDALYHANVRLGRSEDGGKTWHTVESNWKHVDNHAVAFLPQDPDFLLVGCDGGLYRSFDRGKTYQFFSNLPLTQFYKVDVDYDEPFYNVVGGTQDNSTQHGPSQTGNGSGIRNSDWKSIIGGDGHDCAIDPQNPDIIYCESQQGFLRRYDRKTGESIDIRPRPGKGEADFRFNWDSPILISPHDPARVYFGSKHLHRSDDHGDSWTPLGPDLSRNENRYTLKIMGRVWSVDALYDTMAMSQYGNITSISESPVKEGLIYVGTDDGLIQVTENGGESWRKIDKIYGVPEYAFVNDIKADRHNANTVYAALDHHKTGNFNPYLVRSRDRGKTWESIVNDLPDRHVVWRFEQDHVKPELFFLGTEFGLFCSLDAGTHWLKLKGGVPVIPFRDLAIQKRENDLVGATFGRSFYVLDDYSFLRHLNEQQLVESPLTLFPVRDAKLFVEARALGGLKGSQGDAFYTAPNPPGGATFTLHLRDTLKTTKQERQEKEGKIKKQEGDVEFPGWDALREETREDKPALFFEIHNAEGQTVRRLTGPTSAGFHRVTWDLRHSSYVGSGGNGPFVLPGTYTVRAHRRAGDTTEPIGDAQSFNVVAIGDPALPPVDREVALEYHDQVGELQRVVIGADQKIGEALEKLKGMKTMIQAHRKADRSLLDEARALELKFTDAAEAIRGDSIRGNRDEPDVPSLRQRVGAALGGMRGTHGPTATHRGQYTIALEQYEEVADTLRELLEKDLPAFEETLEAAGIPWTQGRPLPRLK